MDQMPQVKTDLGPGDRAMYMPIGGEPVPCTIISEGMTRVTIKVDGAKRPRAVTWFALRPLKPSEKGA